jgi:Flp pilus assembly protein TadD
MLAAVTIAAYSSVGSFEFLHYDDPDYVTKNHMVLNGLSVEGIRWAATTNHFANWSPLTWISHMADTTFFGLGPKGPHLTNLVLHIFNTLLLFWVLRRMTGADGRSAFVAALFAVHPMHVESVAWIAERKDVLSTFFGMLALCAYAWYSKKRSILRYTAVFLLFACSLMAKSMWVTFPFLLLLLDYWPLGRFAPAKKGDPAFQANIQFAVIEKLPLLGLTIVTAVLTVWAQGSSGAVADTETFPMILRVMNAVDAYTQYVLLFFVPQGLAAFYPHPGPSISMLRVVIGGLFLVGVTVAGLSTWRSRPHVIVGWFLFLGTLVPVIGIVQVGSQAYADRYTYLPYVGLSIALVWLAGDAMRKLKFPAAATTTIAVAITLVAAALTKVQTEHWRNDEALWRHAVAVTENNYRAYANLGHALKREKTPEDSVEAISYYVKAAELYPNNPRTYVGLGDALEHLDRLNEAESAYRRAIAIDGNHPNAYINMGALYFKMKKFDDAVRVLEHGLRLDPLNAEGHNNLGSMYAMRGDFDRGITHFQQALRLRPGYTNAQSNLDRTLRIQRGEIPPR